MLRITTQSKVWRDHQYSVTCVVLWFASTPPSVIRAPSSTRFYYAAPQEPHCIFNWNFDIFNKRSDADNSPKRWLGGGAARYWEGAPCTPQLFSTATNDRHRHLFRALIQKPSSNNEFSLNKNRTRWLFFVKVPLKSWSLTFVVNVWKLRFIKVKKSKTRVFTE